MDYTQLSSLELVIELLKEKGEPTPILDLIREALKLKGIEDQDGAATTRLYVDITTSSDFVFCGEGKWDLKANQALEVFDRDGSYFGQDIAFDDDEEETLDASEYDIDDDSDKEDRDEEDEEDIDNYEDEADEYEEEKDVTDDDVTEDDEDTLDSGYDEDKYNDIMDDYEDMYDN